MGIVPTDEAGGLTVAAPSPMSTCSVCGALVVLSYGVRLERHLANGSWCAGSGAPIDIDPVGRPGQQQGDQQWPEGTSP